MPKATCGHPNGCPRPHYALGWCNMHWRRWKATGDPGPAESLRIADIEERFFSHVRKMPDGCWHWTAALFQAGYGEFGNDAGEIVGAHRWSYEHFVKPIPDGLQIDHLCHTRERDTCPGGVRCLHRRCVNPEHLQPVTQLINNQRGIHRGMVSDEYAAELYARRQAGESVISLAQEAGVQRGALYKRFRRIEDAA